MEFFEKNQIIEGTLSTRLDDLNTQKSDLKKLLHNYSKDVAELKKNIS